MPDPLDTRTRAKRLHLAAMHRCAEQALAALQAAAAMDEMERGCSAEEIDAAGNEAAWRRLFAVSPKLRLEFGDDPAAFVRFLTSNLT